MEYASVRYIVDDVAAAVVFYTELLGFQLDLHPAPGFAQVSRGALRLLLNRPGAGGAGQAMPDGRLPEPGGWNRIRIEVEDLLAMVTQLEADVNGSQDAAKVNLLASTVRELAGESRLASGR